MRLLADKSIHVMLIKAESGGFPPTSRRYMQQWAIHELAMLAQIPHGTDRWFPTCATQPVFAGAEKTPCARQWSSTASTQTRTSIGSDCTRVVPNLDGT